MALNFNPTTPAQIERTVVAAERRLALGDAAGAFATFNLGDKQVDAFERQLLRAVRVVGPLAGMGAVEIYGHMHHGLGHPVIDLALGALVGALGANKIAAMEVLQPFPGLRVRIYRGLGRASFLQGRNSEARAYFSLAIKYGPDDPETRRFFAEAL